MATVSERPAPGWSLDRLQRHFDGIPAERIRLSPPPGSATEADLVATNEGGEGLCELVDGTLVEKPMGYRESTIAFFLSKVLGNYLERNPIGLGAAPDGLMRLEPGLVRAPDVSITTWDRIEAADIHKTAYPDLAPDLAIEIVSPSNTKKELARKTVEYFEHGTRAVWIVWPKQQRVEVFTSPTEKRVVEADGMLDGGTLLPGFSLALRDLFAEPRRPRTEA